MEALHRRALSPAFRMAVLAGASESVRLHLRRGGDVDATDEGGRSALTLAASRGRLDVCRLLLEEGADPTLRDHEGNDALAIALSRGHAEIAELLMSVTSPAKEPRPIGAALESRQNCEAPEMGGPNPAACGSQEYTPEEGSDRSVAPTDDQWLAGSGVSANAALPSLSPDDHEDIDGSAIEIWPSSADGFWPTPGPSTYGHPSVSGGLAWTGEPKWICSSSCVGSMNLVSAR